MVEMLEEQEENIWIIYGHLVPFHLLNHIEITNYFKFEPRFNGVFSRKRVYLP